MLYGCAYEELALLDARMAAYKMLPWPNYWKRDALPKGQFF
jgi:hypothetical protein